MEDFEIADCFGDLDQRGIVVEEDGKVVGWTGWNTNDGVFYAHSTFCDDQFPHAYACLVQELRRLCRAAGHAAIRFYVDADNQWYLEKVRQVKGIRAVRHVFDLEV
jgi:hypothetical protein